jgi:hypothetical protein
MDNEEFDVKHFWQRNYWLILRPEVQSSIFRLLLSDAHKLKLELKTTHIGSAHFVEFKLSCSFESVHCVSAASGYLCRHERKKAVDSFCV